MICNTNIGKFIKEHKDWETLLTQKPYCLRISYDGDYVLLKYSQIDSDFSNPIVQEARGIIFKKGYWDIPVCHAFNKFFNVGETNAVTIDWSTAMVSQKVDGSICKIFYDNDCWHISTNGMIDAYKAIYSDIEDYNFGKLFEEALKNNNLTFEELTKNLTHGCTYMFELVSPKTRVVIPYEKTDLYYLGCRDNFTNVEWPFYTIAPDINIPNNIKTPILYSLNSVDKCLKAAQNLPWDEEGYVVCDINRNRVKIKSPQYVLAHYVRNNNNITNEVLVDVVNSGEQEEFLTYASDYKEALHKVTDTIKKFKNSCIQALEELNKNTYINRKEYALAVQEYPENIRPFLFANINKETSIDDFTKDWNAKKWLKYIEV